MVGSKPDVLCVAARSDQTFSHHQDGSPHLLPRHTFATKTGHHVDSHITNHHKDFTAWTGCHKYLKSFGASPLWGGYYPRVGHHHFHLRNQNRSHIHHSSPITPNASLNNNTIIYSPRMETSQYLNFSSNLVCKDIHLLFEWKQHWLWETDNELAA